MITQILVAAIALLHLYILALEMFWWTRSRTRKAFGTTLEFAQSSKAMAANQGLYNGFLAAGLVWGLLQPDFGFGWQIQLFFLACVAVAGLFGAATVGRRILFIQTVPAVTAMIALILV
ncbi:DUF1304 domain-containing protein [Devosia algicola]|uniref:DUF1304 domain-containing protein n=1 Tax=Devosia algicola TaxID=3026418 RepID=A0ABY7YSH3_9HYPH|nr:DUF1304 domain-containing protein [Devosia algicola]WDR04308.1 DUF1304 domain-containing protein [Devosia algicola]